MLIFVVMSNVENPTLANRINDEYPRANFSFAPNIWFVADSGVTVQEVSRKLDIIPGGISGAVVVGIEKYYGFATSALWDWLKVKIGEV